MRALTSFAAALTVLSMASVPSFAAVDRSAGAPLATPTGITLKAIRVEQGMKHARPDAEAAVPALVVCRR